MSVIASLLGRRPSRERPDLAAWLEGASPVLLVEGAESNWSIPGARVLRHESDGGPGLPCSDSDPRRLGGAAGEMRAVVLDDVLDKVLDVAFAVEEACRVLAPDGPLVVVQTVAPENFEQRAIWNAVATMHDVRHTWTPPARQLAAVLSGCRLDTLREAEWEETVEREATRRPEAKESLSRMLDAAAARGATDVVRDGAIVVVRRAWLLRRR